MIGLCAVRSEISVLAVRLDGVERRTDHLDRDVRVVVARLMDG
jgi:hypothetical protein